MSVVHSAHAGCGNSDEDIVVRIKADAPVLTSRCLHSRCSNCCEKGQSFQIFALQLSALRPLAQTGL
jgi:spore coat polysaccharide biosynthesis protein SpsF (cytidylyltransferase family)